jgi:O-antigen/teichoic acid export membrane protein
VSGAKIGLNSIVLVGSEAVRRVLSLVVMSLIARALTVEDFGIFRLSNAFLMIFLVFSTFGLIPLVTKRVAAAKEDERRLIGNVQGLKIALSLATIGVTCLVAVILDYDRRTLHAIFFSSLAILPETLQRTHVSWYDGRQRMALSGIIDIMRTGILLAITAVSYAADWGLYGVLTAYLIHYLAGEIIAEIFSARYFYIAPPRFHVKEWLPILREALPFLIIGIVWIVTFRIDMIMLSKLKNEFSVGIYGTAYSLFEVLIQLPILMSRALFPALSESSGKGLDSEMMRKSMRIFFLVALPAGLGTAALSTRLIILVFSEKYTIAGPTLAVMSSFLIVWFWTMGLSWAMTARGLLRYVLKANIIALVANVAANFILIPRLDYLGSGIATVFSELVYLAVLIVPVHREFLKIDTKIVHWGTLVSAAVMTIFVMHFDAWPLYSIIPAAAALYALCALVTGALREPFIVSMARNILARRS